MLSRVLSTLTVPVYQEWSLDHQDSIRWQHAQRCVISSESRGPPVPLEKRRLARASRPNNFAWALPCPKLYATNESQICFVSAYTSVVFLLRCHLFDSIFWLIQHINNINYIWTEIWNFLRLMFQKLANSTCISCKVWVASHTNILILQTSCGWLFHSLSVFCGLLLRLHCSYHIWVEILWKNIRFWRRIYPVYLDKIFREKNV